MLKCKQISLKVFKNMFRLKKAEVLSLLNNFNIKLRILGKDALLIATRFLCLLLCLIFQHEKE